MKSSVVNVFVFYDLNSDLMIKNLQIFNHYTPTECIYVDIFKTHNYTVTFKHCGLSTETKLELNQS